MGPIGCIPARLRAVHLLRPNTQSKRHRISSCEVSMKHTPALLLTLASLAFGHHSFQAEYDQSKPLTLVGKVTKVVIENPHGWIYLEVQKDNGKTVSWQIETPAPGALNRNGSGREVFNELVTTGER